jgi:hypothetical protein
MNVKAGSHGWCSSNRGLFSQAGAEHSSAVDRHPAVAG